MNQNNNSDKELYRKIREKKYCLDSNGKYCLSNKSDSDDVPDLIYHYTSLDGFEKIISEQRFRMTGNTCLNDPTEYQYAKKVTIKRLQEKWLKEKINDIVIKKMIDSLGICSEYPEQFIMSFSEKYDDLNQWRCYGDDGFGVCFGYRPPVPNKNYYRNFHKLLYNERDQINWIDFIVKEILDLKIEIPSQFSERWSQFDLDIAQLTETILFRMKHHAYKDEAEWRYMTDAACSFSKNRLISEDECEEQIYDGGLLQKSKNLQWDIEHNIYPRHKYYFKPIKDKFTNSESGLLPIEEVWLGPCFDKSKNADSLRLLLSEYKETIRIINSEIPYIGMKCNCLKPKGDK